MSSDCTIRASLKVPLAHADAAIVAVKAFVQKKRLHESKIEYLEVDDQGLGLEINLIGHGGMRDDDVESLARQLGAYVTAPGYIEFIDHDAPVDSDDALTLYWVGSNANDERRARIAYAIHKMREWIGPNDFEGGALDRFESALKAHAKGAHRQEAPKFDFLYQSSDVADLLRAAQDALPLLLGPERDKLESAMRAFENTTVVTSWSIDDMDSDGQYDEDLLSDGQKREALLLFAKHYEIDESEWTHLSRCTQTVLQRRKPGRHLKVTFLDGGIKFVPVEAVERALKEDVSNREEAVNIALDDADLDINGRTVDFAHHYNSDGSLID